MATLICPECGLVELANTDRCPECGLTALDDANPANRDAIDEAIRLREQLLTPWWFSIIILAVFLVGMFGGVALTKDVALAQVIVIVPVVAVGYALTLAMRARMTPGWRAALRWHADLGGATELRRQLRFSATRIAVAICLAFVVLAALVGRDALVFQRGDELTRPWRLVTSAFSHAGTVHLVGNMLALLLFGTIVDLRVGRLATAAILATGAVAGALAQARYSPTPMLGFSAAIYGLIGANLALVPTWPRTLVLQAIVIPVPTWLWSLLMIPLFTFTAWVDQRSHVAWAAHLGGFLAGFLVALPMRRLAPTPSFAYYERQTRERIERIAAR